MLIAVFSDSHDNIWKLDRAFREADQAELWIHCGDLCSPFVIRRMGQAARGRPVHVVWGNNEGDVRLICETARDFPNLTLHGALAELRVESLKIAVNHYPEIARPLAASGQYDVVCYGHDHTAHEGLVGECLLLNPGELMGLMGPTGFALLETSTREVRFVEV